LLSLLLLLPPGYNFLPSWDYSLVAEGMRNSSGKYKVFKVSTAAAAAAAVCCYNIVITSYSYNSTLGLLVSSNNQSMHVCSVSCDSCRQNNTS
jgi:hypothetical protein